ncbi:Alpha/Beta hydrolase protein [Phaeosphaeriaceae sp. PMI808]|nr:Alpha/Beta hydrolase protein [Phaeosphaeriaceae sp. PMI808]
MAYNFVHPTLGSMAGLISAETPDIVRFRTIPYATLPGRFKHSLLLENLNGTSRNFTKSGYACPHTIQMDDINSGGSYPGQEPIKESELECLILEVNVPKSHLETMNSLASNQVKTSKKLPVMIYIHGGGFSVGNIDAQHNTAHMAQHSIAMSKPVIEVAIQYRLGVLGFLATPDGGKNFALKDQHNALLWIQKFIEGFGGDKGRVTAFGESAGGFSISYHMLSHLPSSGALFNRAILMSGVPGPTFQPISQEAASDVFNKICESLGIQERGEAALAKLRALDVQAFVSADDSWTTKGNSWAPIDDTSFFREKVTWDQVPQLLGKCEWVDEIIVGNTGFEGLVYQDVAKTLNPLFFLAILKQTLSDEAAKKVMEIYGITLDMDQNLFMTPAMRWSGDNFFEAPVHALAQYISTHTKKPIYRYHFDVRNPFPGATYYQQSHHWVDIYFIFRAMQFRMPFQYLKDISDKHAAMWIGFANGHKPWSEFKHQGGTIMVADEREGWVEKKMSEYEKMSRLPWARLDTLWQAWGQSRLPPNTTR